MLPLLRLLLALRDLQALDRGDEDGRPDEHAHPLAELLQVDALLTQVGEQRPSEVRVRGRVGVRVGVRGRAKARARARVRARASSSSVT